MYALWNSLDEADQRDFNMDPLSIDWPHYAHDIQLPSTVKMARLKMQPSKGPSVDRNERIRKNVLSEDRHLAVFDLENTLIASNVVASYSWLATRHLDTPDRGVSSPRRCVRPPPSGISIAPTAVTSCATSTAASKTP